MIGVYDYTVILTYLSLLSACTGIAVSLSGGGHPYWGMFALLLCGLFDAFDGRVARTKKDRTEIERNFGIQIDSLSDLVAFGVLPACIGIAMLWRSAFFKDKVYIPEKTILSLSTSIILYAVLIFYVLAAMIRLAYFNVTEEERQRTEATVRHTYTGLPVTSACLIFPLVMVLDYEFQADFTPVYFVAIALTGFAFVSKIQVPKPGLRGILVLCGIGIAECVLLILKLIFWK